MKCGEVLGKERVIESEKIIIPHMYVFLMQEHLAINFKIDPKSHKNLPRELVP
jgi:hypothetical protein